MKLLFPTAADVSMTWLSCRAQRTLYIPRGTGPQPSCGQENLETTTHVIRTNRLPRQQVANIVEPKAHEVRDMWHCHG